MVALATAFLATLVFAVASVAPKRSHDTTGLVDEYDLLVLRMDHGLLSDPGMLAVSCVAVFVLVYGGARLAVEIFNRWL